MAKVPGVGESKAPARILPAAVKLDEAFWVAAAEGAVRDYCQWNVAPRERRVFALDGGGRRTLLLPTMRLIEVHSVVMDGREVTSRVRASESGMIELDEAFACGLSAVLVDVTHGYDAEEIPAVQGVIASAASRFSDAFGATVQSQTAGGSTVSFFAGSEALLKSEKDKLDKYRLGGRS